MNYFQSELSERLAGASDPYRELRSMSLIPPLDKEYSPAAFDEGGPLDFGYRTLSIVHSGFGGPKGPELISWCSQLWSTNMRRYESFFRLFNPFGDEPLQFTETAKPKLNPHISRDKPKVSEDDFLDLMEKLEEFPVVGLTAYSDLNYLFTQALGFMDKNAVSGYQSMFFDESARVIDLRRAITKISDMEGSLDMGACLEHFGLSDSLLDYPPCYNISQAELFNKLLHLGSEKELFSCFETFIDFMAEPIILLECPIGRHKNKPWKEVPRSMLNWLRKKDWIYEPQYYDLRYTLNHIDEAIELHAKKSRTL